jgi:hypothetical protein
MDAILGWLKDNKEAVIPLAALLAAMLSPAIALVVSYRAVGIQRETGANTLAFATRQLRANLLGSYDQKWVDAFRDALAELMGLVRERLPIMEARTQHPEAGFRSDRLLELMGRAVLLINKIRLLLGSSDARADAFASELQKWLLVNDLQESADIGEKIVRTAVAIIEEREKRIALYLGP